ncbi:hydroxysqualene dehydroxylase HpnE [Limnohabitans sp. B9-3]|uniref:hydroxysqualene dehydroxylase HpnE n=1 Tax=Limnohabitans sp. B9-3 TaxID=1100707 RepID=UPI0026CE9493
MKHLTIVGAGWAGLAAAVSAVEQGWQVELYEAAAIPGGRARSLGAQPNRQTDAQAELMPLDNGQHILIGAYSDTLALMRKVGVNPEAALERLPLDLRFADGSGLSLPNLPAPLNVLVGITRASGWTLHDKALLLKACAQWQWAGFTCEDHFTVADLCAQSRLPARVMQTLIEPLCLSALNTPISRASAAVFLRVLHDALLSGAGSSDLLLPRLDLSELLPAPALRWLKARGAKLHVGHRVTTETLAKLYADGADTSEQRHLVLACPSWEAARLTAEINPTWARGAAGLKHEAIATVYLHCADPGFKGLVRPMVALQSEGETADKAKQMVTDGGAMNAGPAQFIFDRSALMHQPGLLACVVSASVGTRETLAAQVLQQVQQQLGLSRLSVVQTVVEKRATLACTPKLQRPSAFIAPQLWACGDYVAGPYPSTLEGAVRSGQEVVTQLGQMPHGERLR